MEYLFITAIAEINYTNTAGQPAKLYKMLCRKADGTQHEVVSSSSPGNMPVAICKFVKKDELLYEQKDGTKIMAKVDQFNVQYYTSATQVANAKEAAKKIEDLDWGA